MAPARRSFAAPRNRPCRANEETVENEQMKKHESSKARQQEAERCVDPSMTRPRKPLIVVPTYNEAENVDDLLVEIWRELPGAHVLFVDDASPDGTAERVRAQQERNPELVHLLDRDGKRGMGTAYVAGFGWALERDYDAVVEMDADLSHDARELPTLIGLLSDADVVIGSRYIPGGGTQNWSRLRLAISRFGSFYARAILGLPIRDLTGGFNAWHRRVLEALPLDRVRSEGYSFQIELKLRAARAGFQLVETPIVFVDRRAGQSKMTWRIVAEAMVRVWWMRLGGS
jgi:dolichol-phosphate mannosyltransferase